MALLSAPFVALAAGCGAMLAVQNQQLTARRASSEAECAERARSQESDLYVLCMHERATSMALDRDSDRIAIAEYHSRDAHPTRDE